LKHCIPVIAASGSGSIINLSSVAGLKASPGLSAYSMTKGGVLENPEDIANGVLFLAVNWSVIIGFLPENSGPRRYLFRF
jgi:hypothetical protein|tara:strand:+ start:337 stop:576 length:240 start_codon:yes stop_codon:yes gene_type:complete